MSKKVNNHIILNVNSRIYDYHDIAEFKKQLVTDIEMGKFEITKISSVVVDSVPDPVINVCIACEIKSIF